MRAKKASSKHKRTPKQPKPECIHDYHMRSAKEAPMGAIEHLLNEARAKSKDTSELLIMLRSKKGRVSIGGVSANANNTRLLTLLEDGASKLWKELLYHYQHTRVIICGED